MSRKRREPSRNTVQLWDGEWHDAGADYYHVCCDCSLTHYVEFRIDTDSGKLQSRWAVDQKMTAKERKKCPPP